ncbi:MAG: site-2 protease family protein [Methanobacteriota archaeon]|nr:MAG: site-2 protease family protein [Euryarchaeota archaeon]
MGWGSRAGPYAASPPPYRITPPARRGLRFSPEEYKHIAMAVGALIAAFTISFLSPFGGARRITTAAIVQVVLGATVAVVTGFLLHELMHKAVAQRYGAWAEFRSSRTGLLFAIFTALIGFVFAAPGAVYIAGPLTREQNGRVSLAGPLTNLVVSLAFTGGWLALVGAVSGDLAFYAGGILFFTGYINAFLGVFNMLPIPPLDGSKVLAWNIGIWAIAIVGMGALLALYFLGFILP